MAEKSAVDYISEKIQVLTTQIQNEELAKFQHELTIADAQVAVASGAANNAMKAQAKNAADAISVCDRRLTVRRDKLKELETQLNDTGLDLSVPMK